MNFIPCRILSKEGHLIIDGEAFQLAIPENKTSYYQSLAGSEAIFGIRPNDIYDRLHCPEPLKKNTIKAVVEVIGRWARRHTSM